MRFAILGEITDIEIIAVGGLIRELARVQKAYGPSRWRKLKGFAYVRLPDGAVRRVELHWYEAHGLGRRDIKIKRYVK